MPLPKQPTPPSHQPTEENRRLVQVLKANGIAQTQIARNLKINVNTLTKYYKEELRHGHEQVKAAVGATVVRLALAGNLNAARFWLLCHGGPEWKIKFREEYGDDLPEPSGARSLTIVVRGGLPAPEGMVIDGEVVNEGTNGSTPPGRANGKDH